MSPGNHRASSLGSDREEDGLTAQPPDGDVSPKDHFDAGNEELALLESEVDGLKAALASRTVIGIALGIIIERERVTEPEAFQILKEMSQHTNVKLRDVAAQMAKDAQPSYQGVGSSNPAAPIGD